MNTCRILKDVCEQDKVSCPVGIHDESGQKNRAV